MIRKPTYPCHNLSHLRGHAKISYIDTTVVNGQSEEMQNDGCLVRMLCRHLKHKNATEEALNATVAWCGCFVGI